MTRVLHQHRALWGALALGALLLLTARQAAAQPTYQGSGLAVQVQILSLADARTQPSTSAPVIGSFLPGELVFLIDGVRDATGARWLQVGRADGTLTGWIAQAAGNILGSGGSGAQVSGGSGIIVTPVGIIPVGPAPFFP